MNCEYCSSKIFSTDRCCPQCGGPISVEMQSSPILPDSRGIVDSGNTSPGLTWSNFLFILLGILFFFPVPGLCFLSIDRNMPLWTPVWIPITLFAISMFFVSLGKRNVPDDPY